MNPRSLMLQSLLGLCLFAACDERTLTGPSVPLNQQFTLAGGESAAIQDMPVAVQFVSVSGDTRCPADAFCIQGGDALVHIIVRAGSVVDYALHTGDSSRASVVHDGLRIALVSLQPYPVSSRTIQSDEYRATLVVSR